jgi:hypothetical protein
LNLLFISALETSTRSVHTISKYVQAGGGLGHKICVFGRPVDGLRLIHYSTDIKEFDFAIFVVHIPEDFPGLPDLAYLLDEIPKERRLVIDCWGRYNETIRVEHDFNHLEKLDGHQGWEWVETLAGVSDTILQPKLTPKRDDVLPFLFHAFDPAEVSRPHSSAAEAAQHWTAATAKRKPYFASYVGNNWQRWGQVRAFLEQSEPFQKRLGPIHLTGWHWDKRPDWVAALGLNAVDVDRELIKRLGVRTRGPIPHEKVKGYLGRARFCPVFQRPLFNRLGLLTNRAFEVFCADAIPILFLDGNLVEAVFGPAAKALVPGSDLNAFVEGVLVRPAYYWDAVLETRAHLEKHHTFEQRLRALSNILTRSHAVPAATST